MPDNQPQDSATTHLCVCGYKKNFEICCRVTGGPKNTAGYDCSSIIKNAATFFSKDIKDLYVLATVYTVATNNPPTFYAACVCTETELWPGGLLGPQTLIRGTNSESFESAMQSLEETVAKNLDLRRSLAAAEAMWPPLQP